MFLSVCAQVILVSTMELVFRVLVHSPVAALLALLDRNVKQRLMHATQTLAIMEQHVTAQTLPVIHALVLLDSLVKTAPQGLTTVITSPVIMVVHVLMAYSVHPVFVCQDSVGYTVRSILMSVCLVLVLMVVGAQTRIIASIVCVPQRQEEDFAKKVKQICCKKNISRICPVILVLMNASCQSYP